MQDRIVELKRQHAVEEILYTGTLDIASPATPSASGQR
jgi:hypothetical protein